MDGASLLSLNKTQTVFSLMKTALAGTPLAGQYKLLTALAAVVMIVLFLTLFLRTRAGHGAEREAAVRRQVADVQHGIAQIQRQYGHGADQPQFQRRLYQSQNTR